MSTKMDFKLPPGFQLLPMQVPMINRLVTEFKEYASAFENNLNDQFYRDLATRMGTGRIFVIYIYGDKGVGKSMSALFLAEYGYVLIEKYLGVSKYFDCEKCLDFNTNALMDKISIQGDQNVFVKDEDPRISGVGSGREKNDWANIVNIASRKKCISLIYVHPEFQRYGQNYTLWAVARNKEKFQTFHILHNNDGEPFGYVITGKPSEDVIQKYTKVAYLNTDEILARKGSKRMLYWEGIAKKIIETEAWKQAENSRQQMLAVEKFDVNLSIEEKKNVREIAKMLSAKDGKTAFGRRSIKGGEESERDTGIEEKTVETKPRAKGHDGLRPSVNKRARKKPRKGSKRR